eukprot:3238633-Pyramimonas_sp.AAC.4
MLYNRRRVSFRPEFECTARAIVNLTLHPDAVKTKHDLQLVRSVGDVQLKYCEDINTNSHINSDPPTAGRYSSAGSECVSCH